MQNYRFKYEIKETKKRRMSTLHCYLKFFHDPQKKRRLHEITTNLSSAVILNNNSREYV